jgi:hypothetical protein
MTQLKVHNLRELSTTPSPLGEDKLFQRAFEFANEAGKAKLVKCLEANDAHIHVRKERRFRFDVAALVLLHKNSPVQFEQGINFSLRLRKFPAFLDTRCLSAQITQIIQLRSTHLAMSRYFYLVDARAMHREYPLYSHSVRNLSHRKRLVKPSVLAGYHYTLKYLDTFTRAFLDLYVHLQRVARPEIRQSFTPVVFLLH